jgi:hypothetical protein
LRQVKIFGKEPALIIGLIGAVVSWVATLGWHWLNAGQATAIITFVSGLLIALTTRPWGPALFVAVVSAGAALFGEYGLNISQAAVAGLGAIVLAGFALFGIRPQVTPAADPAPTALNTGQVR